MPDVTGEVEHLTSAQVEGAKKTLAEAEAARKALAVAEAESAKRMQVQVEAAKKTLAEAEAARAGALADAEAARALWRVERCPPGPGTVPLAGEGRGLCGRASRCARVRRCDR